jgi:hypothetical protein
VRLSITFLHDIGSPPRNFRYCVVSIAGCLSYLYFLALFAKGGTDCKTQLFVGNIAGLFGFGAALILLTAFGWCDIP